MYNLQTFGIPCYCFPLTPDGKLVTKNHGERLEKRRQLERMKSASNHNKVRVGVPGRHDVLLGRGKASYEHMGNLRLRYLVESRAKQYDLATRSSGKKQITHEIVQLVKDSTGRFLEDDAAGWVEVEDDVARLKVSHIFRTLRGIKLGSRIEKKDKGSNQTEGSDSTEMNSKRRRH
jgi:hypothetical protein